MKTRLLIIWSALALWSGAGFAGLLEDGWAAYNSGEYEKAYDLFSKAFREDPGSVRINFALGEAAVQKKKYSHAVFAYDRVLMAQPDHQRARYGKARALLALGQESDAREQFAALLDESLDPAVRSAIEKSVGEIDRKNRELKLSGELSATAFYDDNINFGPSDGSLILAASRDKAAGLEIAADLRAEYDIGRRDEWVAVGGLSVLNTWLDGDGAQEIASAKVRAGARRLRRRDLLELSARAEKIVYGHDDLVDIYGVDGAWLYARTKDDYLITRASVEHRDYDDGVDPSNQRDSIYAKAGETWKHFFDNRNNTLSCGAELFLEEAESDVYSNNGFRLKLDGERETVWGVITYAGGRFRLSNYEEAAPGVNEREDQRWDLIVGAKKELSDRWTIDLRHWYVRNDSNVINYDYQRHRTSLTATFEF